MATPSIRTHLLLLVMAVSVPLVAAVGLGIYSEMQQTIAHTKISLRTLASTMVSNTGGKIANARQILERLADRPLVKQVDPDHCDPALPELLNLTPGYANVTYSDLDGQIVCSALPQPGGMPAIIGKTPWFQKLLKERRFSVGQPFYGTITGKWVSVLSAPIWSERQEMIGAVHMPLDLAVFDPHIPTQFLSAESRYGFFNADGIMIWRNRDPEDLIGTRPNAEAARRIVEVRDGEFESLAADGVTRYFSVVPMPETGWIAYVGVPTSEIYAPARQRAMFATGIALAAIALLVLFAINIARRIARPVSELETAAHAVHSGYFGVRVTPGGPREVAAVAQAFNAMIEAQHHSDAQLRAFLENRTVIAWLKDMDCRHVFVSDNFLRRFALSRDAVIGKTEHEIWPQAIADARCANDLAMLEKGSTIEAVEAMLNPDRSISWWLSNKFIYQGSDGQRLLGGLAVDITERKQAEEAARESDSKYRLLFEQANDGIFLLDGTGFLDCNQKGASMFGLAREDLLGRSPADLSPERQADGRLSAEVAAEINAASLQGETQCFEWRALRADGVPFDVEVNLSSVGVGGRAYLQAIVREITERKRIEAELRIAATAFESQEGMIITDANQVIVKVNQAFTRITGYSQEDVLGRTPSILRSGRHDHAFYQAMWEGLNRDKYWQGEIWNRRKNGEIYPQWHAITAILDEKGNVSNYFAAFSDITLHKQAQDKIQHLAFTDPLTELPNRRLLMDRLHQALAASARNQRRGALILIDLDNFKTLNDTLGHDKGDLLLQQVAQRLATCVREGDTVARLGGDEFVVMLEDLSENLEEAATQTETVGEKIIVTLNQPYLLAGHENRSTPSLGVTLYGGQSDSIEELLKQSDLAMYQSKAAGRNTLRFFDPQMQAVVTARAALEVELRDALNQRQFVLYYQPQVVGAGRLTGAEALVRWQHPQRGLVSPAEFIPLAEETGLILPLGQWILETACKELATWAAQPNMAHLSLAVNVSASQLHQVDFVEQVLAVLGRTGANPHNLKLELTESLLVVKVEETIAKMSALKAHGVGFSMDDFGTGYSSLSYLKRLPLDQLKIDQGFVRDILIDPNDAAIAKMVIALAESMGLTVIAEGVEIQAQRDYLASQGCHAYQGYLFSLPMPADEFEKFTKRV